MCANKNVRLPTWIRQDEGSNEEGAEPGDVWIGADALGVDECVEIAI